MRRWCWSGDSRRGRRSWKQRGRPRSKESGPTTTSKYSRTRWQCSPTIGTPGALSNPTPTTECQEEEPTWPSSQTTTTFPARIAADRADASLKTSQDLFHPDSLCETHSPERRRGTLYRAHSMTQKVQRKHPLPLREHKDSQRPQCSVKASLTKSETLRSSSPKGLSLSPKARLTRSSDERRAKA